MTIRAAFFDLDGTLIDSLPSIAESFKEVRRRMAVDFPLEQALSMVGIPLVEIARTTVGEARVEEFLQTYSAVYAESSRDKLVLFPGTEELLRFLKCRGCRLAVVTSKRIKSTEANLKHLQILHYFDALITPDIVKEPKPAPEPVLLALEKTRTTAAEAVMVGDTEYDILAGNRAGVQTIAVTWGNYDEKKLTAAAATYTADTMQQLREKMTELL